MSLNERGDANDGSRSRLSPVWDLEGAVAGRGWAGLGRALGEGSYKACQGRVWPAVPHDASCLSICRKCPPGTESPRWETGKRFLVLDYHINW